MPLLKIPRFPHDGRYLRPRAMFILVGAHALETMYSMRRELVAVWDRSIHRVARADRLAIAALVRARGGERDRASGLVPGVCVRTDDPDDWPRAAERMQL